jgi:transcriptional regulator of aromatic amino acid metabolism
LNVLIEQGRFRKDLFYRLRGLTIHLSDALESLVNLVGAIVALAMLTVASRPADDDSPANFLPSITPRTRRISGGWQLCLTWS